MDQIQHISSRSNEKLKRARKVRDGSDTSMIFIEGVRLAEEAVRSELEIRSVFVSSSAVDNPRIASVLSGLRSSDAEIIGLAPDLLESIADTKTPQGIVLVADRPGTSREDFVLRVAQRPRPPIPLTLFLSEANNPSNLGAVLRTAEAAGVSGVITSSGSADAFSAKAIRASMGSAFRLPVWERADPEAVLEWAKFQGLSVVATRVSGARAYTETDWTEPHLLVFGSEARGLDEEFMGKDVEAVMIPMQNDVESLNLAVSCGIILFEAVRQNTLPEPTG